MNLQYLIDAKWQISNCKGHISSVKRYPVYTESYFKLVKTFDIGVWVFCGGNWITKVEFQNKELEKIFKKIYSNKVIESWENLQDIQNVIDKFIILQAFL